MATKTNDPFKMMAQSITGEVKTKSMADKVTTKEATRRSNTLTTSMVVAPLDLRRITPIQISDQRQVLPKVTPHSLETKAQDKSSQVDIRST